MAISMPRVQCTWSGFVGAPAYSSFYFYTDVPERPQFGQGTIDAIRDFWTGLQSLIPADVDIHIPGSGDIVSDIDGALIGSWATANGYNMNGQGAGAYSAPTGAVVHWLTTGIHNKRRTRGSTFVVPLVGSAFESDGSLTSTALTDLRTAAQLLVTPDVGLAVWARPTKVKPGEAYPVTSSTVPDMAAVLRSRRD